MRIAIAALFAMFLIGQVQQAPVTKKVSDAYRTPTSSVTVKTTAPVPAIKPQPEIAVAAAPVAVPQIVPLGCAAYVPLLQQYNWDVSVMAAVMQAESGCDPNAVNTQNYDGVYDYGLMQLHGQEIFDPATNIAHAYSLWTTQGYGAWSTFNNGDYLKYL